MLEIHPARTAPVAFQNIRYIRIDSHKTKLGEHSDKEARLWEVLGQKADWSGELVAGASLDDLAPEAIEMARKRFIEYLVKSEREAERHEQIRHRRVEFRHLHRKPSAEKRPGPVLGKSDDQE